MNKIRYFLAIAVLSLLTIACSKQNALEDVELSIAKLNQFNSTFENFYKDGVIEGINLKKGEKKDANSEYNQLKKLAEEYYELINRINSNIKEDKENVNKGKKSNGYEEKYKKAIESKKDEIEKVTDLFITNLNILNNYSEKDKIIEEEIQDFAEETTKETEASNE